ncbi:MAG: hypothetical protein OSA45_16055 [Halioglobus sp.]|nr:hypothetical protein [Halioglobus sp.]
MKDNMVLFSHIHKCGGTTLKWILRNSFALRHLEADPIHPRPAFPETGIYHSNGTIDRAKSSLAPIDRAGLQRIQESFPHVVSLQSHNLSPAQNLGNHRWFTFLREPRKQVASWFQYLIEVGKRTDLEFFDYMKTEFPHNRQTKMLAGQPDFEAARSIIAERNVFCGLVEDFDRSLLLLNRLYIQELRPAYMARGVAKNKGIASKLLNDPEALHMIDGATVEDRKLYDHVRNEVYPAYVASYGTDLDADLLKFKESGAGFNMLRLNASRFQSRFVYDRLWVPRKRKLLAAE